MAIADTLDSPACGSDRSVPDGDTNGKIDDGTITEDDIAEWQEQFVNEPARQVLSTLLR